jgi:hypothetical protein
MPDLNSITIQRPATRHRGDTSSRQHDHADAFGLGKAAQPLLLLLLGAAFMATGDIIIVVGGVEDSARRHADQVLAFDPS